MTKLLTSILYFVAFMLMVIFSGIFLGQIDALVECIPPSLTRDMVLMFSFFLFVAVVLGYSARKRTQH